MLAECIVDYLGSLDDTSPIVEAFGEDIIPGTNLFAYTDLPKPHSIIWVVAYSTGAPNMADAGLQDARVVVNVRSFNYGKAINTAKAIAEALNGSQLSCSNYSVLLRATSIEPTPSHMDQLGRMTYSIEFYVEFR